MKTGWKLAFGILTIIAITLVLRNSDAIQKILSAVNRGFGVLGGKG